MFVKRACTTSEKGEAVHKESHITQERTAARSEHSYNTMHTTLQPIHAADNYSVPSGITVPILKLNQSKINANPYC